MADVGKTINIQKFCHSWPAFGYDATIVITLSSSLIVNFLKKLVIFFLFFIFFNCYLAAPRPTSGHYRGDSLTHPMLVTAFLHIRPDGHREPRSEVGSLSPAERLVGFEPGTFRF